MLFLVGAVFGQLEHYDVTLHVRSRRVAIVIPQGVRIGDVRDLDHALLEQLVVYLLVSRTTSPL